MYFTNGNYIMGGNFKIKKQAPMDDRSTVAKKIDLQNPNLFDGFTYNGMIVSVVDDTINNGLYRLYDKSTLTWKKEGSDVNFTASLRDKLMKVSDNNRGAVSNETALASIANPMEGDFALVRSTLTFWAYESGAWVDTNSSTTAGSDGLSAYELDVLTNGYSGTLEQWLIDLKGEPGTNFEYKDFLKDFSINGKHFDENNNIELEGVSTLVSPELNLEKLTEYRHPVTKKPLYTKTIDFGYLPNNTTKVVPHNVPDIEDTIIDYSNSYIYIPGIKGFSFSGFSVWSAVAYQIGSYVDNGSIVVGTGNDRTNMKAIFTINYTKTTDTAESPVRLIGGGSGGSGLSIEDKTKLDGIEAKATKNNKDWFLLSRSNHTGLQPIDTISGLAESLLGKADINTVYAEPMSTNYTTRNEVLDSGKTFKYPLNGVNNNYALHAFALKELPVSKEVISLNTALIGSGYYGVKIPRINNIQLSFSSGTPEPLKRMTTHNQYGQTVSATTEHSAAYTAWKIFSAGDAPTATDDCWASSRAPTPSDPQIITFTSPNTFLMSRYKIRSRNVYVASIKTWKIEGRVGNSGNWELIHEVINDTRNDPLLDRVFDIPKENRKACDQHRLVIFDRNGTEPYTVLSRLIIYQEPSKFMIEDGVNKYRSTSTGFSLSYTPMTKHSEHNQVVSATSEYDANYVVWRALLAGDATSNGADCWASIAAPTALAPQIITIDFGQPKKIYSYSIVNRFDPTNSATQIASPSSWSIEVRNNLLDDWVAIDNIQGDKDNNSLSVRKFSIAEEKRGEWRYFRIVIKDRNGTNSVTCISRLRIYGDLIGEELKLVPNVITKNDITVNGTSNDVFISKEKLSTLSNPYIITNEPSAIKLTIDSEKEYEYSNNVKIALANTYIKFTATESGKYKFCYQEPAPDIP